MPLSDTANSAPWLSSRTCNSTGVGGTAATASRVRSNGVVSNAPAREVQEVAGRDVAARAGTLKERPPLAGSQNVKVNVPFIPSRARPRGEEQRFSSWKHLWPPMAHFALAPIQSRDLSRSCRLPPELAKSATTESRRVVDTSRPVPNCHLPAPHASANICETPPLMEILFSLFCAKKPIH